MLLIQISKMQSPRSEFIIGFLMILTSIGMIIWSSPPLIKSSPEVDITVPYSTTDQLRITFSMDELHHAAQRTACTLISVHVPPVVRSMLVEQIVANAIRFHTLPNATDYCPPIIISAHVVE